MSAMHKVCEAGQEYIVVHVSVFLCYCQTERDTVEVIAYLKKEDGQKDQEIDSLRQQVKDIRVMSHNERDILIAEHEKKVTELEDALNEKNEEVCAVYQNKVF